MRLLFSFGAGRDLITVSFFVVVFITETDSLRYVIVEQLFLLKHERGSR